VFDVIWVIVDQLSKMRHYIPRNTIIHAQDLAEMLLQEVVSLDWRLVTIVSYMGCEFTSTFWVHMCDCSAIDRRISLAFHSQRDC